MSQLLMPHTYHTGDCFDAYRYMGAHPLAEGGYRFAIWAPSAKSVSVLGEFSGWQDLPLEKDDAGVWQGIVSNAEKGQLYKYRILGADDSLQEHTDPFAFEAELRPGTASRLSTIDGFCFEDEEWMKSRTKCYDTPLNIYEMHFGSWKHKDDDSWYSYEELAAELIPWLKKEGFTHIELLPMAEHPLDGSWGYQTNAYFAPTSRYGSPEAFAGFVNECHKQGIGVLIDFVPVHFIANADCLARLDGTELYEHAYDVGRSEWGTLNFNFFRGEVCSFLQSAAALWLDVYHCDGIRMDAISRALYWMGNENRGTNPGALKFLRTMNEGLHRLFPTAILAAEDSTSFPKVTAPVQYGGLGFDYKWDMGWMHDTLDYFAVPFWDRHFHYHKLTFSMAYFYNELFMLALSHDETVHGKKTVLDKLFGTYEQKFDQGRLLYLYMYTHPGKKLNFMGNEIGHLREWDESKELDWFLLKYPTHDSFALYMSELGRIYKEEPCLHSSEYDPACFNWVECNATEEGIYAYRRCVKKGESILVIFNMLDRPCSGKHFFFTNVSKGTLLLNTQEARFTGSGAEVPETFTSKKDPVETAYQSITMDIPPLCGLVYRVKETAPRKPAAKKTAAKTAAKAKKETV